jgi:protein SCO1
MCVYRLCIVWIVVSGLLVSCGGVKGSQSEFLPIFGEPSLIMRVENGVTLTDTVWPVLPGFSMLNQLGDTIRDTDLAGKMQVVDFFFTTCPTICPIMSSQMLRVYEAYSGRVPLVLLSYTIDPYHDTVEVLADYASKLEVEAPGWHFLLGGLDEVYELAEAHGSFAMEDKTAPGGFEHSGALILVDPLRRVRGVYNGVDGKDVDRLLLDIELLWNEFR